ncbi:MAG TPA: xanthine dehydrogenase family protein subunit M [Gemmatimonadaceae bacterium]|jgi:carbon-monoxide dehydrogenase medium subunit|nr:xanthine dehydrogenase family protein subunit M [Gemmatimonadaceae bacterium]
MYPASFEYHRATTVDEALALLSQYGDDGKLIAGGHSLLPVMKLRFARPAHLIDIRRLTELAGIHEEGGAIRIGATTTHAAVASSDVIRHHVPMLAEAAGRIADAQVRNMGTIGGSLAHADPAADLPAVTLALGAELHVVGRRGPRAIPVDEFFTGMFSSALAGDEMLVEVRVPVPPEGTGGAYEKYADPASGYAVVGVAAMVTLGGGVVQRSRVALTGYASHARRLTSVEEALTGKAVTPEHIEAAAGRAIEGLEPRDGPGGAAAHKASLVAVYTRRALARAADRARR